MGDGARVAVGLPGAGPGAYEIRIESGLADRLPDLIGACCPAHRYALITDSTVEALHARSLYERLRADGASVDLLPFPAGEAHKTRDSWAALSDRMLELGMGRDAAVLAVGGGVVGDLAGFVAATYLRGIPYVQIPTTLLAMIDSSVGGKTGVDTIAGKNLIGAFHQPRAVLADPAVLDTLPRRELAAGLAEAVKHGAIADAGYFGWIESRLEPLLARDPDALSQLITRSVEIKAAMVARDERESGPRKTLNFGHTLGHAIEALSGYRLLHGEAISIGMVGEARAGEAVGVTERGTAARLASVLAAAGLPTGFPDSMTREAVLELTRGDKKARGGAVEYALIRAIGRSDDAGGRWSRPLEDDRVLEAMVR
jgi:3-dehydroquinate synthase